MAAFMWDFRNVAGGGMPRRFQWWLFSIGELIGLLSFSTALRGRDRSLERERAEWLGRRE
jgi:hypothetical protein